MFVDARTVPAGTIIETEVCIVGAGAAGITLGREFIDSGFRVVLLESGDTDFREATQALYDGTNIGRRYFEPGDVGLRLRYFGGATNHWGGWCAIPDPVDFEVREGIRYSGWPFTRKHLEPWYRRAQDVLQLGPYGYGPSDWDISSADIPAPFNGPHFACQVVQVNETRFGPDYGPELRQAQRLIVYLNANALRFETSDSNDTVQSLSVGVLPDHRFTVRARIYVVAAGGIENARLLLLSGKDGGNGLGNGRDLVGRFFMVHLEYPGGLVILADPMHPKFTTGDQGFSVDRSGSLRKFVPYFCLSEDSREKLQLPQLRILFSKVPTEGADQGGNVLSYVRSMIGKIDDVASAILCQTPFKTSGHTALSVYCSSEQMPNPDSRIGLGPTTDSFGLRKVTINWQLTPHDKRGMAAGHRLLGTEIGRVGLGRFWSAVTDDDGAWPRRMFGNQHTIGTTRMHRDPASGVADENCRVHGVQNLYVAGSSVFPTEGTANPTLTIVAMSLRLADHIKEKLK